MSEKIVGNIVKMSSSWIGVLALYASAMCSAQILERELVQVLYFLRIKSGELKEAGLSWAYDQMVRKKPFELLDWIRGAGGNLSPENQESIRKALRQRNFLAHEFFHKHNPVMSLRACERTATKLRKIEAELDAAYQMLQPLRQKLEIQLGLSVHRENTVKSFERDFVEAIASFDSELLSDIK